MKVMTADFSTLAELLGLPLVDVNVKSVMSSLQGPCIDDDYAGSIYKCFRKAGIAFLAEETPKPRGVRKRGGRPIRAIFLYAQDRDGFSQYRGALPNLVEFGEALDSVLAKLGDPKRRFVLSYPQDSPIKPGIKEVNLQYESGKLRLCYSFDGNDKLSILQFGKQKK